MRAAEACAATMAALLPPEMVIRVLNPIIKTGDFPVNQVEKELKQLLFSNLYLLGCHQNVDESCWEANNRQYGDTRGGGDAGIVEGKFYKLETKWIYFYFPQAYDNVESSVRKASVFCIVAIHQLVGEANLQPHLDCLNGSKMKLLSLYIKRAQAQSNAGNSFVKLRSSQVPKSQSHNSTKHP